MAVRHELFPSVFIWPEQPLVLAQMTTAAVPLHSLWLQYFASAICARGRLESWKKRQKQNKIIVIIIINTTIVSVCTRTSVHERAHICYKYSTWTLNSQRWYRANVFNRQCGYSLYEWSRQRDVSHIQTSLASTVKPWSGHILIRNLWAHQPHSVVLQQNEGDKYNYITFTGAVSFAAIVVILKHRKMWSDVARGFVWVLYSSIGYNSYSHRSLVLEAGTFPLKRRIREHGLSTV